MSGWISVKDSLPDKGPHVLTFCVRGASWVQQAWLDQDGKWRSGSFCPTCGFMGGDFIMGDVTHWMPLPSPPNLPEH